jgi:hypothetical protein
MVKITHNIIIVAKLNLLTRLACLHGYHISLLDPDVKFGIKLKIKVKKLDKIGVRSRFGAHMSIVALLSAIETSPLSWILRGVVGVAYNLCMFWLLAV